MYMYTYSTIAHTPLSTLCTVQSSFTPPKSLISATKKAAAFNQVSQEQLIFNLCFTFVLTTGKELNKKS